MLGKSFRVRRCLNLKNQEWLRQKEGGRAAKPWTQRPLWYESIHTWESEMLLQNNGHQLWERGLIWGDGVHYDVPPWRLSRRSSNEDQGRSKGADVQSPLGRLSALLCLLSPSSLHKRKEWPSTDMSFPRNNYFSGIREWGNWKDHSPGGKRSVGPPGAGRAGGSSPPQPKQEGGSSFWQMPCMGELK